MKIVIAPDKFKGSLTAIEVADAIAKGVRNVDSTVEIDCCPMADGGEGTVAAMVAAAHGRIEIRRVTGPLPEMKVDAPIGLIDDGKTAVIEMASAAGLALLKDAERDPMATTTFGVGELLMAAAELGVHHILLGIGGSATVDGGIGCAQACGLPVLLQGGGHAEATEPLCGRDLPSVLMIKRGRGSPVERCRITVACDVTNPLTGPNGAAHVYGPQKGARPEDVRWLDAALLQLAKKTGHDAAANTPGAGAAGGLGFGMLAWFNAELRRGIDMMIDATHLSRRLRDADLCITGEGRLDSQSFAGKTAIGVARAARALNIPCIALVGALEDDLDPKALHAELMACFSICTHPMTVQQAMSEAPKLLSQTTGDIWRTFLAGRANPQR